MTDVERVLSVQSLGLQLAEVVSGDQVVLGDRQRKLHDGYLPISQVSGLPIDRDLEEIKQSDELEKERESGS